MKQLSLALAVFCGFLGDSARADHERLPRQEWYRVQSGPAFPQNAYWTNDDALRGPAARGRFGRGRRFEHQAVPTQFAPGWGGYDPVQPPPPPAWPAPGVGLPGEGPAAFAHYHPGDFAHGPVSLYPHVRVKDGDKAPRHGITVVLAVANPNRRGGPESVFVPVRVPTRPLRDIEVKDGGEKIKLDYDEIEIEIESRKGVVTVEYDD